MSYFKEVWNRIAVFLHLSSSRKPTLSNRHSNKLLPPSDNMAYSSEELISRALKVLKEDYNPKTDTFFLVHTKNGRFDDREIEQFLVGEISVRSTLLFMWQTISHFANILKVHPFVYITRHVMAPFLAQDKLDLEAAKSDQEKKEVEKDPDFGDIEGAVFVDTDLNIKN